MRKGRKRFSLLLSVFLLTSSFYFGSVQSSIVQAAPEKSNPSAKAFDQKVIARVDSERIYKDIHHLSEKIGPRVTGTKEEKQTAEFIKKRLQSYGYNVEVQEFNIPDQMIGHLLAGGNQIDINIPAGSAATAKEGLTAELYDAKLGKPEDFTAEVVGKIALISRGEFSFQEKVANAVAAGAAGVLIYDNIDSPGPLNPSIGGETSVPVGGISKASGLSLLNDIALQGKTVTFTVEKLGSATSQNIIGTRKPKKGSGHDIVHVSAHFDSVPFAPGANDNASGTSVALELARILKSYPIDKELRFVFVGAEEIGLVGSEHYVSQLSQDEVKRSIANFNMDMVGTDWENATAIFMNAVDGKANIVSETALATAKRIGTPSELILYQRGSSDHVSFHDAGIPAINFIRREPGTANLEPYYHTPQDTIEHISKERLQEAGELVGASIYSLIRN
ncbi:MAG TPA: DUF4910 domain-containing protein [Bacillus bacterium]|uniref:Aminopeptidase YwaD n=1 Tax=Siminovitchia fordii TaxID=254759 RepID=A0ABQ4K730_9BACI|nr:DUF4910 domain-containing protein [Siminovitchia fordii]GIN21535.1 aminopeptidase YwaD [Siminovitchia fordii]HBZ08912.1 DUF4910 domain-containing protein [Bacillus sp. (in: firmicutes)]